MEPDARVLLLRHGTADAAGVCYGQRLDPSLSQAGRQQVLDAAGRLSSVDEPQQVVCSPARRAMEAAALLGYPAPQVDARWIERDFGDWEGRSWTDLWAEAPEVLQHDAAAYAAFVPPGAERPETVEARVTAALAAVAGTDGTTLVVTHAGPIRMVLAHVLGVDLAVTFHMAVEPGRAACLQRIGEHWILEGLGW